MTSPILALGCSLIAFSPTTSLLILIIAKKAQLVIIVTSSAFAYLLSSLLASGIWFVLPGFIRSSPFFLIPVGVASQFFLRVIYVRGYMKIENLICSLTRQSQSSDQTGNENALVRLELNDWSCGIASGVGFGGMHAIMLYGTLLSSEFGNLGTLYQPSCPLVPSLVLSAINAFLFSILDIIIMLLTFYGTRLWRRNDPTRFFPNEINPQKSESILFLVFCFHLFAASLTSFNLMDNGCYFSLPLISLVVLISGFFFTKYSLPNFLLSNSEMDHSN